MVKKILVVILFVISTDSLISQNFGVRIGVTTATLTGNNDAYDFDFMESFSPGYKVGALGSFQLSDIIILKPEFSYRTYAIKQKINNEANNLFSLKQSHSVASMDLNFDIKLPGSWSLIFGMGVDYLVFKNNTLYADNFDQIENETLNNKIDQQSDPFANIGVCYTIGRSILLDLEYRHLLDNWGSADLNNQNQLINSENKSVKLHMINLSAAILF